MEETGKSRKRPDSEALNEAKKQQVRKKSKKARKREAMKKEEQRLTELVFGGGSTGVLIQKDKPKTKSKKIDPPVERGEDERSELFEIDRIGATDYAVTRDVVTEPAFSKALALKVSDGAAATDAPAWVDEEDSKLSVNLLDVGRLRKLRTSATEEAASALNGVELERRLRDQHQITTARTARTDWAEMKDGGEEGDNDDEEEDGGRVQGTSMSLLRTDGARRLEPNKLDVLRCPDANLFDPNSSVVQCVQFHPGSDPDRPLLLTAGFDKTLRFFQVGAEGSKKIHGIHLPSFPIHSASFLGKTGNVICTGRRSFFYIYDSAAGRLDKIPRIIGREEKSWGACRASPDGRTVAFAGNDGFVVLYDAHSKQWIADVKLNGSVRTLDFSPDGSYVFAAGSDGDVYRWDVKSKKCVERFSNHDGTQCTALAVSSRHLAVGSFSGVVNLYDSWQQQSTTPDSSRTPVKSFMNLQSGISSTCFNGDGQLLAIATNREKDCMRMIHVPTATVFANWPTTSTPLGYVWSMDFSPSSQFFAMGNDKGKCLIYQLKQYVP